MSAGDAATAERAAHSLKGAAGTLGAHALSEAAAKAETAIKSGHGIDDAVRLAFACPRCRAGRSSRRAPRRRLGGNGAARVTGDPATVKEPLIRLKQLLETDDGEAADFIVDAKPRLAGVLTPDRDQDAQPIASAISISTRRSNASPASPRACPSTSKANDVEP